MTARNALFVLVALATFVADQVTKAWVVANVALAGGQIPLVDGWVSMVHRQNSGAAFGTLTTLPYRQVLFGFFTLVAFAVIVDVVRRLPDDNRGLVATCGLLLGGAAGNAVDRLRHGYVTDFIRLHVDLEPARSWFVGLFGAAELPSFNLSDAAIVAGMGLFIVLFVRLREDEELDVDEDAA
ncbi:MAG: signal peptidase II [Myxococcota bacterium]|jgi:signal peptidase II